MSRFPCRAAAFLAFVAAAGLAPAQCAPGWAATVVSYHLGGSASGTPPANILGDTPNDYHSLGDRGHITVAFAYPFVNTGNPTPDLDVDEYGVADCYRLWLKPGSAATIAAVQAAGWDPDGDFYGVPPTWCGDAQVDLDVFLPGHAAGTLFFVQLKVYDDGDGGNGCEINRIQAASVCNVAPPPPPPPAGNCAPDYASRVVSYSLGANHQGTSPTNALGDTPNDWHSLGNGGQITVDFPDVFANSGDAAPELFVDEYGDSDCYWVCVVPADAATAQALQTAGISPSGSLYQLPQVYCGDAVIDLDAFVPGRPADSLHFTWVMIEDDGAGGNGAEIILIRAERVCQPPPPCVQGFAAAVTDVSSGTGVSGWNPANILGDTPSDFHRLGNGGHVTVTFANVTTNSGTSAPEWFVDEYGTAECYGVRVDPADAYTEAACVAAGLIAYGGFYQVPALFCGDQDINVDSVVPGHPAGSLHFWRLQIVDDANGSGGAEINLVRAEGVCLHYGRLGDRVWLDVDCDGLQEAGEQSLAGYTVTLYGATGNTPLDVTTTDANGRYTFFVAPGTYRVGVAFPTSDLHVTVKGAGSDPAGDSDLDVATGKTDPITVPAGAIRTDIDHGLCVNCLGVLASVVNHLPACGLTQDPVLTVGVPALGSLVTLSIQSPLPDASVVVFAHVGPPVPYPVPGTPCTLYVDVTTMVPVLTGFTDSAGNWSLVFPMPVDPAFAGIQLTLQARVCNPAIPGPIPGFPDWLSTGSHLTFGCL